MLPGTYLEKRRLMAGYSLSSLARELLLLTGFGHGGSFGRAESDFRRLRMTLISAEQGSLHHGRDRVELIRAFVPLDVSLYLHLVECDRSGEPFRASGVCRCCACSFHDPCVLHVGPTAALGASVCDPAGADLCSACEQSLARLRARRASSSGSEAGAQRLPVGQQERPTIAEQLRDLGPRMERLNRAAVAAIAATQTPGQSFVRLVPTNGEQ